MLEIRSVYARTIERLAEEIGEEIATEAILRLQKRPPIMLSEHPSMTLWDEICIQARRDSPFEEMYRSTMAETLAEVVSERTDAERVALWLQTYHGMILAEDKPKAHFDDARNAAKYEEIVEHMLCEHMNFLDYENDIIRLVTE
jgi:hypothetical protein